MTKKGDALGLGIEAPAEAGCWPVQIQHPLDQGSGFSLAQGHKLQASGDTGGLQGDQPLPRERLPGQLLRPQRSHHQQPRRGQTGQQDAQGLKAGRVHPVYVFEDDQVGRSLAQGQKSAGQGLQQAALFLFRLQDQRGWRGQRGEKATQFPLPHRRQAGEVGVVQHLDQGLIGWRGQKLVAVAPGDPYALPGGVAGYLLHQPGLAHPRLPDQQDHPPISVPGQLEAAGQFGPLDLAAHERHLVGPLQQGQRRRPRRHRQVRELRLLGQRGNLVGQGHRAGRWLGIQLVGQYLAASLVLLQRLVVPSQQVAEAHHLAMGPLAQRVLGRQAPGVGQRAVIVSARLVPLHELLQHTQQDVPQSLSLQQHPVVVVAGQEFPPVVSNALLAVGQGLRALACPSFLLPEELLHVDPQGQCRVELDGVSVGQQGRGRVWRIAPRPSLSPGVGLGEGRVQGAADLPQGLSQAPAGRGVGQVGPEGAGQQIAGVGLFSVGNQVGEEGAGHCPGDGWQRLVAPEQGQSAQEMNTQWSHFVSDAPAADRKSSPISWSSLLCRSQGISRCLTLIAR